MITRLIQTARRVLAIPLMAVFFSTTPAFGNELGSMESQLAALIERLSASVVTIEASHAMSPERLARSGQETRFQIISSGIVYDSTGKIIVSAPSVINREQIVVYCDDQTARGRLVGVDYHTGLALLQAEQPIGCPAVISRDQICNGRMVVALGNAYGVRVSPSVGFCAGIAPDGRLHFTAPVTSGSLGGGVFDLNGQLVGIVVGGVGGDRSEIGAAIGASDLISIVEHLETFGDRHAGFMGVSAVEIEISPPVEYYPSSSVIPASYSASAQVIERGLAVTALVAEGPAASSGLRRGDIIFSLGGNTIANAQSMMRLVRQMPPGASLKVGVLRHGRVFFTNVKVGQAPLSAGSPDGLARNSGTASTTIGPHQADSLLRVIENLKHTIGHLENELRRRR
jgi:serine protease Do